MSKKVSLNLKVHELRKMQKYFVKGKDGAIYFDAVLVELKNKQYNTHMIVRKTTKEEREKGIEGEILGHGKDWDMMNSEGGSVEAAPKNDNNNAAPIDGDDLPF